MGLNFSKNVAESGSNHSNDTTEVFAYANVSAKSKPYSKIEARKNRGNTSLNNLYIGSKLLFQTHFFKKNTNN